MSGKSPILVTEHSEFLRASKGSEHRYYPPTAQNARAEAMAFDDHGDFAPVMGFGVYDTTVSTSYAVALYATKAEADSHKPTLPEKPTGLFPAPQPSKKGKRKR